jgi:hypothetical protein
MPQGDPGGHFAGSGGYGGNFPGAGGASMGSSPGGPEHGGLGYGGMSPGGYNAGTYAANAAGYGGPGSGVPGFGPRVAAARAARYAATHPGQPQVQRNPVQAGVSPSVTPPPTVTPPAPTPTEEPNPLYTGVGHPPGGYTGGYNDYIDDNLGNFNDVPNVSTGQQDWGVQNPPSGGYQNFNQAYGNKGSISGSLSGGYGQRQLGGPVGPGQYTVGENGPETLRLGAGSRGAVIPGNMADRARGMMDPARRQAMVQALQGRFGGGGGITGMGGGLGAPRPAPMAGGGGMPRPATLPAPAPRPMAGGGWRG